MINDHKTAVLNTGAHLSKFQPFFAADMPLLDIGCGNGSQTIFLSGHYRRVIGLDFSPSAIENAVAHGSAVAEFRQFDLLDEVSVTALHRELGDCNIYIRTVLHNIAREQRQAAIANLAKLLGANGHLFAVELSPEAVTVLGDALAEGEAPKIHRVLEYGIVAEESDAEEMEHQLRTAGLGILATDNCMVQSSHFKADGSALAVPGHFWVARLAGGAAG
jgi:SAM-dependent methyltransferase